MMTEAPVLSLPDFSLPFTIECDACAFGVGAVLSQNHKPLAYFSQALQGKNLLLSTYDKELLALILSVKKWRQYLLGTRFTVKTDHKSLQNLWNQKIVTPAQQRWLIKLVGYDFDI